MLLILVTDRHTDREGNVDIISIRDLPIPINDYPIINHELMLRGRIESRRIHTATKEMTLEEIEKKLGHKVKIVSNKEE